MTYRLEAVWKYHCPGGCYVFRPEDGGKSFHCPKSWFWKGK